MAANHIQTPENLQHVSAQACLTQPHQIRFKVRWSERECTLEELLGLLPAACLQCDLGGPTVGFGVGRCSCNGLGRDGLETPQNLLIGATGQLRAQVVYVCVGVKRIEDTGELRRAVFKKSACSV